MTPVGGSWPWADAEPAVLFDEWTETPYWRLSDDMNTAPATPAGEGPGDWVSSRPDRTQAMPHVWTSTREGSKCSGYTWTPPMLEPVSRTIYKRTDSSAPPPNPTDRAAVPVGWSATSLAATSTERHVYSLTAFFENGAWQDWADAGDPMPYDTWTETPWWQLVNGGERPATPVGDAPDDWVDERPAFTGAPQCRWVSKWAGSPLAGYTWTTPERDGANEDSTTIYMRTNSATPPPMPSGLAPRVPSGWSGEEFCATSTKRFVHSLTVSTGQCVWPDWSTGTSALFETWTETPYWIMVTHGGSPPEPPTGWQPTRPPLVGEGPLCRWTATQVGSDCAGYTWTPSQRDGCNEASCPIYKATATDEAPAKPGDTAPVVPTGWTKDRPEDSEETPYCWKLTATTTHCVWPGWADGTLEGPEDCGLDPDPPPPPANVSASLTYDGTGVDAYYSNLYLSATPPADIDAIVIAHRRQWDDGRTDEWLTSRLTGRILDGAFADERIVRSTNGGRVGAYVASWSLSVMSERTTDGVTLHSKAVSAGASGEPPAVPPPTPPSISGSLTQAVDARNVTGTVSWGSSSDADGYRLELLGGAGWHTSGNGLGDLGNVLSSNVAFNAAGMNLVGQSVAFRVRAYDSDGNSGWRQGSFVVTRP